MVGFNAMTDLNARMKSFAASGASPVSEPSCWDDSQKETDAASSLSFASRVGVPARDAVTG